MKKILNFFLIISVFYGVKLDADTIPTALTRNNMFFSHGTLIQDPQHPNLPSAIPDSILYTGYLDYLVQNSTSDPATLNIYVGGTRSFRTGPFLGISYSKVKYPGVKGIEDSGLNKILYGMSDPTDGAKNTYTHLQIGYDNGLKRSLWCQLDSNNDLTIDAYRNMNQLLEPANPQALGLNILRNTTNGASNYNNSGSAGDIMIGGKDGIQIKHNADASNATVTIGHGAIASFANGGLKVYGDVKLPDTKQLFGRIGDVISKTKNNCTFSGNDAIRDGGALIGTGETTYSYTNNSNSSYNGFVVVNAVTTVTQGASQQLTWGLQTKIYKTPDLTTPVFTSQPCKFEFGAGNPTETLINMIPVRFDSLGTYQFEVRIFELEDSAHSNVTDCDIQIAGYVLPTP